MLSKQEYSNVSQTEVWGRNPEPPEAMGVWGQSPQPLGNFSKFLEKKAILILLDHILQVFKAEMETGRVAGRVEILRPAGQAG